MSGRPKLVDRGEYRPIYVALVDGKDFQVLFADQRWTLVCLKLSLGMLGIAVIPGISAALADRTGYSAPKVGRALDTLQELGWIERERNVTWLVRGFEFEPAMSPDNTLHRKSVQRQVEALPSLPIVARFRAHYAQWFDGPLPEPPDSPSRPSRNTETETETLTETETETSLSRSEPPAPDGTAVATLLTRMPTTADRWAVFEFLERVPDADRAAWIGRLAGYLEGLTFPAGMCPTAKQLATACSDFTGDFKSPAHFRGFVLRVIEGPRSRPPSDRRTSGSERTAKTLAAADRFVKGGPNA